MALDKSLVSGSTTMLLLRLLSEKDMYGYEMIETLRERSKNVFELKAGTLYPLLHSLEEKQVLRVYEKEAGGKIRKYYSLTKEGEGLLAEKKEEWLAYSEAILNVLNTMHLYSREQRAGRVCLHAHLATAARVKYPTACSGVFDLFRDSCGDVLGGDFV